MTGKVKLGHAALIWAVLASLVGCASAPPPTAEIGAAEAAIAEARRGSATDYAPVELDFAEQKLQAAQAALEQRDNPRARDAAAQAQADAELALAKSRAAQARAEVQLKSAANAELRGELLGEESPR